MVIWHTVATSLVVFPDPAHLAYETGDYYRYVNMALPDGDPRYVYHSPFLYRILTPGVVHVLSLVGIPFRAGFFGVTCVSMCISIIAIFFIVRGIGLSRVAAAGAALGYVSLQWAVAYNIHDYFLVDPPTQAFICLILLAGQRRAYGLAVVFDTIGVICKETIYLPIAFTVIQLLIPHLRPLTARVGELQRGQVLALVRRIPRSVWLWVGSMIAFPLIATTIVHYVIHADAASIHYQIADLSTIHVWKHYIPEHFQPSPLRGFLTTVARSTWGTYRIFFALAVAAVALKLWRRAKWSIWALLVAGCIILYAYTVSGDAERLSINGWPFIIVLAAVTIEEISKALRVASVLIWAVALVTQLLYEPLTGPPGPGILGPLAPTAQLIGPGTLATMALLVCLATLFFYQTISRTSLGNVVGKSTTAVTFDSELLDDATAVMPSLTASVMNPRLDDLDSRFWIGVRGGVTALDNSAVWIAMLRLRELAEEIVFPLAARRFGVDPQQVAFDAPQHPHLTEMVMRWQPAPDAPSLWQAYQSLMADYHALREQMRITPSIMPQFEHQVHATVDVAARQQPSGVREVVTWRSLSIVLPAYNEELVIGETVQKCLRVVRRLCPNTEIIVVDDGSRDRTGAIADDFVARDARVVVVHNRPNRGYGGALLAGFAAARGELLFFMDSDGQFDINDLALLLAQYERQPNAAILGYRAHRRDKFFRRVNAWGWKQLVGIVLGLRGIKDIDCAFKVFPARAFHACNVTAQGAMVNTEMLLKFQKMRLPFVQVPVKHFERKVGAATGANLKVIAKAFREMLKLRMRLHEWKAPQL